MKLKNPFKKNIESSVIPDQLIDDEDVIDLEESNSKESITDEVRFKEEVTNKPERSLNKKAVGAVTGAAVFVIAGAMAFNSMTTTPEPKGNERVPQNTHAANNSPASGMPDKYSDISKEHGTQKDSNGTTTTTPGMSSPKPQQANSVATYTTPRTTPQQVVVQRDTTAEREAKELAKKEEAYRNQVIASPIAFKIASDISRGKSPQQAVADAKGDPNAAPYDTTNVTNLAPKYLTDSGYLNKALSHVLHAGTVIQATMLTGISTDIPNNEVVAVVRQNIYDSMTGTKLLIPQGSKIIGKAGAQGGKGIKRIGVTFSRIILPNGNSISLPNIPAIDGAGMPGMEDKYDTHTNSLFKTAFMSSLVTAVAQSATGDTGGTDTRSPGQEAVSGAVSQIADAASKLIDQAAQTQATIEIRPGKSFSLFVTQDLNIPEYIP